MTRLELAGATPGNSPDVRALSSVNPGSAAADPAAPVVGDWYFNTASGTMRFFYASGWVSV